MSIDKNTYKQSCSNWKISPEKKQHIYTGMKVNNSAINQGIGILILSELSSMD